MASKIQTDWEKNKKNNFVTLSNASAAAKPKPSGANVVSGKSANLGAGKATSGANVVSSASADLGAGKAPTAKNAYNALQGNKEASTPVPVFKAPTVKTAKAASFAADPNIKAVGSDIATEAYKQRLAAQQAAQSETVEEEKKDDTTIAPPGGNQGMKEQPEQENNLEEYLAEMEEYWQDALEAEQAKYDALLGSILGQKGALNAQYDAQAADLYELYRRSMLAYPEMMSGTATGIADSLTLQNDLNFQNNLADNELARAAALEALQTQANQIQADADLQAAKTAQEWAQMAYQYRMQNQSKGGGTQQTTTTQSVDTTTESVDPWEDVIKNGAVVRGFGRMTAAELQAAIEAGLIDVYEENGQLFFRKAG